MILQRILLEIALFRKVSVNILSQGIQSTFSKIALQNLYGHVLRISHYNNSSEIIKIRER